MVLHSLEILVVCFIYFNNCIQGWNFCKSREAYFNYVLRNMSFVNMLYVWNFTADNFDVRLSNEGLWPFQDWQKHTRNMTWLTRTVRPTQRYIKPSPSSLTQLLLGFGISIQNSPNWSLSRRVRRKHVITDIAATYKHIMQTYQFFSYYEKRQWIWHHSWSLART